MTATIEIHYRPDSGYTAVRGGEVLCTLWQAGPDTDSAWGVSDPYGNLLGYVSSPAHTEHVARLCDGGDDAAPAGMDVATAFFYGDDYDLDYDDDHEADVERDYEERNR